MNTGRIKNKGSSNTGSKTMEVVQTSTSHARCKESETNPGPENRSKIMKRMTKHSVREYY